MNFNEYIEQLASFHKGIKHDAENEIHFTDLAEDANILNARRMHYPCVVLDCGDIFFDGSDDQIFVHEECSLMFLDHVKDSAKASEVRATFVRTKSIMMDFLARISRDRRTGKYRFLNRMSLLGSEARRIYMAESNLYGYIVIFRLRDVFHDANCNLIFSDGI